MCKDSVNEGNYGVYHREELSEEAERRNWEKGVEVREAKDYKLREMEGNEEQEKDGAGEQSESLEEHRKMCEAEDKDKSPDVNLSTWDRRVAAQREASSYEDPKRLWGGHTFNPIKANGLSFSHSANTSLQDISKLQEQQHLFSDI